MGRLYDNCQEILRHIDSQGMDPFRTRGALALSCGFIITLVTPDDADDPEKIRALHQAANEVLGMTPS